MPEPEAVNATAEYVVECIAENCSGVRFCANCGVVNQIASQCVEAPASSCDDFAYSRCAKVEAAGAAVHSVPLEDDRVFMLHPAEPPAIYTPLSITCGTKQVQTCLEPTTFDPPGVRSCPST